MIISLMQKKEADINHYQGESQIYEDEEYHQSFHSEYAEDGYNWQEVQDQSYQKQIQSKGLNESMNSQNQRKTIQDRNSYLLDESQVVVTNQPKSARIDRQIYKEKLLQVIEKKKKQLSDESRSISVSPVAVKERQPKSNISCSRQKKPVKPVMDQNLIYHSSDQLKQFLQRLGDLKYSLLKQDILNYYTMITSSRINSKINCDIMESYVKQRNENILENNITAKKWDLPGFFSLLWIVCKMVEHKEQLGCDEVLAKFFTEQDYEQMDKIFPYAYPKCRQVIDMFRKKKYTDRWTEKQSELLKKICNAFKVKRKGELDFQQIADTLSRSNKSGLAAYRCPMQCQRQWKRVCLNSGFWTPEEDDKILRIIDARNNFRVDWRKEEKKFVNRSHITLRTRSYTLLSKIKAFCPKYNLTNLQLIRQRLQGRVQFDEKVRRAQIQQGTKNFNENRRIAKGLKKPESANDPQQRDKYQEKLPNQPRVLNNIPQFRDPNPPAHRRMGDLIVQLEEYLQKAYKTLAQIKRVDGYINGRIAYQPKPEQTRITQNRKLNQSVKSEELPEYFAHILSGKRQRINNDSIGPAPTKRRIEKPQNQGRNRLMYRNQYEEQQYQNNGVYPEEFNSEEPEQYSDNQSIF